MAKMVKAKEDEAKPKVRQKQSKRDVRALPPRKFYEDKEAKPEGSRRSGYRSK